MIRQLVDAVLSPVVPAESTTLAVKSKAPAAVGVPDVALSASIGIVQP